MTAARPSSSPATRLREVLTGLPGRAVDRLRQAWVRIALTEPSQEPAAR